MLTKVENVGLQICISWELIDQDFDFIPICNQSLILWYEKDERVYIFIILWEKKMILTYGGKREK